MTDKNNAKEIALSYINHLNKEDFVAAQSLVTANLLFEGVLGTRNGAEAYFDDMKKMKFKYRVTKAFAEGEDVCVLYDIVMQGGITAFTAG